MGCFGFVEADLEAVVVTYSILVYIVAYTTAIPLPPNNCLTLAADTGLPRPFLASSLKEDIFKE